MGSQAPVLQASGPRLLLTDLAVEDESLRPVAEVIDCLRLLDFDGAVEGLCDQELWTRIRDSFARVCAPTHRLRCTVDAWALSLEGCGTAVSNRLARCAELLRQIDFCDWLVPSPSSPDVRRVG